jgi:hypothetical protein
MWHDKKHDKKMWLENLVLGLVGVHCTFYIDNSYDCELPMSSIFLKIIYLSNF